uniref:F-box domain-containing protein n=1 Tax=Strongyloides papillosus TaxID=174720 RepID=A0A0N5BM70_STREA
MDELAKNLLLLPDDFKLQIFKKLGWESLKELKLVCKDLYFLIERNIHCLDRPKISHLLVNCNYLGIRRFYYTITGTENPLTSIEKVVEFENEPKCFLRNMDFTKIKDCHIDDYFFNGQHLCVSSENHLRGEFFTLNFSIKLLNGKFREILLSTNAKEYRHFGILNRGNLLTIDSLKNIGFF